MAYEVRLAYFRPTGRFLAFAQTIIERELLVDIWDEVVELRRLGSLPGLRPNAGRDLIILVDVHMHPERKLHLLIPPTINDDDITPVRVPTGEMTPLVRMPMDELPSPRTTTRDVVKVELDETTPIDVPIPTKPK